MLVWLQHLWEISKELSSCGGFEGTLSALSRHVNKCSKVVGPQLGSCSLELREFEEYAATAQRDPRFHCLRLVMTSIGLLL